MSVQGLEDYSKDLNSASICADIPPLRMDQGGVIRVGKDRITLDLVVEQYENGMTPEEMVRAYDSLVLADVYATIAYYLRRPDEVRVYLKRRVEEAEAQRAKIEAQRPRVTREELLRAVTRRKRTMLRLASDADVHGDIEPITARAARPADRFGGTRSRSAYPGNCRE